MPGHTQLAQSLQPAIDKLEIAIATLRSKETDPKKLADALAAAQESASRALPENQRYLFDSLSEALVSPSGTEFRNPDTRGRQITT
jgi:hypothetical protein